ncbi:MAG: AbrB/MazE/SpoVT family DNA-binding domain-containing protein [Candidatus Lokiarchaeota archaeon]|nr:AbrB/MazE/SpoVT family DNA-binding domain-containing protein [Candidatus Lokiarchaeota archaeon]MBD3201451.1 AbrB/MazE/SpoVT family DNA-binding domain-containing protein [Candidatus Lokiarchaeota archaeon]
MNAESEIDEKGRIQIPKKIRERLNIKSGEKLFFQIEDEKIILRKTTSIEDFVKISDQFSKILKEITDQPIEFKKLFD